MQMPNTLAYLAWVSLFKKVNNNTAEWQSLEIVKKLKLKHSSLFCMSMIV
jgi:hypothetical protein